jgi:hypothetical protein
VLQCVSPLTLTLSPTRCWWRDECMQESWGSCLLAGVNIDFSCTLACYLFLISLISLCLFWNSFTNLLFWSLSSSVSRWAYASFLFGVRVLDQRSNMLAITHIQLNGICVDCGYEPSLAICASKIPITSAVPEPPIYSPCCMQQYLSQIERPCCHKEPLKYNPSVCKRLFETLLKIS